MSGYGAVHITGSCRVRNKIAPALLHSDTSMNKQKLFPIRTRRALILRLALAQNAAVLLQLIGAILRCNIVRIQTWTRIGIALPLQRLGNK
jgi:hypothetical protein